MQWTNHIPLFSIVLCLLFAAVSSVLNGKSARNLSLGLMLAVFVGAALCTVRGVVENSAVTYWMGHFPAPFGNEIRFGILEPFMVALFAAIILVSIIGGNRHLIQDVESRHANRYYIMLDLLMASILALCYTNDIFTAYVFVEICTLASCGILMLRDTGRTTLAAVRYMIFSLVGSGLFLLGIIILYDLTGHLLIFPIHEVLEVITQSGDYHLPMIVSLALMTLGLGIKSGMFPFYFWMPDTYGESTPASASILSGVVSKVYIFVLLKVILSVVGEEAFFATGIENILFGFGVLAMIFGSLSAMRENDIRRMLAWSSASQIGYIYMGIGLGTHEGLLAVVYQIVAHSLTKVLLFLAASSLSDASGGSRKFHDLQGSALRNPVAGIAFTVGSLSMVGLPLFMGFVSKYLFMTAALQVSDLMLVMAVIALALSTVLNTAYFLRTTIRIWASEGNESFPVNRVTPGLIVSCGALVVGNMVVGYYSQPLISILQMGLNLLG